MKVIEVNKVKDPEISVIIPTLNEEDYIGRCLFSLRDQDFDDYEIIVADSYSEDKTIEIAKEYADKIVLVDKRGNPSFGRNAGAKVAKGKIFVFLDADTIVSKNLLKEIHKNFDENTVAGTGPIYVDNHKYNLYHWFVSNINRAMIKINKGFFPGIFSVVRRETFFKIGGWPENILPGEEVEFSKRINSVKGRKVWLGNVFILTSARRLNKFGLFKTLSNYLKLHIRSKKFGKIEEWGAVR